LREALVALRFCDSAEVPTLWAQLAMRCETGDRWYLEALGIGSDGQPNECLAAWEKGLPRHWRTANSAEDIVWRVRADDAAMKMAEILCRPTTSLEASERFYRSLEFHPTAVRTKALQQVVDHYVGKPIQGDEARTDTLVVRALERM